MVEAIGYKICLFPNKSQVRLFEQFANTSRGLYNLLLAESKRAYEEDGKSVSFKNNYSYYKELKYSDDFSWIREVPEACCKQVCKDLSNAYTRTFNSGFGFPKFKKKGKSKLSFYQRTDKMYFSESRVHITGVGLVRCQRGEYPLEGYCNPRVTFDGKYWYISFSIKGMFYNYWDTYSDGIGLDMGIKDFCTVSDGTKYFNYNEDAELIRLDCKLKRLQEVISKKYEVNKVGNKYIKTKNIIKLEKKIRLLQRRMHNIKLNYVHNYSSDLVRTKPEFIAIENLDIKGMKEADNNISKNLQKLMWYEFIRQLTYKSEYYGIKLVKVDRYFPSSQLCSCCHNKISMPLQKRLYSCDKCGLKLDRDINASINIRNEGRRLLSIT